MVPTFCKNSAKALLGDTGMPGNIHSWVWREHTNRQLYVLLAPVSHLPSVIPAPIPFPSTNLLLDNLPELCLFPHCTQRACPAAMRSRRIWAKPFSPSTQGLCSSASALVSTSLCWVPPSLGICFIPTSAMTEKAHLYHKPPGLAGVTPAKLEPLHWQD